MKMLFHTLPLVALLLSLVPFGVGAPLSGAAEPQAVEKSVAAASKLSAAVPKSSAAVMSNVAVNSTATVPKPSAAVLKSSVAVLKPSVAVPKSSVAVPKSTTRSAIKTATATPQLLALAEPPALVGPVLLCFSGACFPSNELTGITSNIFKRDEPNDPDSKSNDPDSESNDPDSEQNDPDPQPTHPDRPTRISLDEWSPQAIKDPKYCTLDHLLTCFQGRCYCSMPKRSLPDESVAHDCPRDNFLVCNSRSCSCSKTLPVVRGSSVQKPIDPRPCIDGAPICWESLCYCPLVQQAAKRSEKTIVPVKSPRECPHEKPLICFQGKCSCHVGASSQQGQRPLGPVDVALLNEFSPIHLVPVSAMTSAPTPSHNPPSEARAEPEESKAPRLPPIAVLPGVGFNEDWQLVIGSTPP